MLTAETKVRFEMNVKNILNLVLNLTLVHPDHCTAEVMTLNIEPFYH